MDFDNIKFKRLGRNQPHVAVGTFTLSRDYGNDVEFLGEFYKKQGGEYRKTPFKINGPLCDSIKKEELILPQILKYVPDFPPKDTVKFT
jgi:hypothetical protein